MVNQKVALICIDGWGVGGANSAPEGNAILNAETPWMDEFAKDGSKYAEGYTEIDASSLAVGLPEGLMGNSEVGHLNIGAGRIVWQDVVRIDKTIKDGDMNKVENVSDGSSKPIQFDHNKCVTGPDKGQDSFEFGASITALT